MSTLTATLELTPATRRAIIDLLYRLADDSLILGHRHSEWTGQGPILEADIALSSMAQDKLGHAFAYYTLLHELGEPDPDTLAFTRSPVQFRCCNLTALGRGDWALTIVRQFFLDEADAVRLAAISRSTYAPLAAVARKLAGEVKYHVMSGRMWVSKLGRATGESRERTQEAVNLLWPHALGIFEPTKENATIVRDGIQPDEESLCLSWKDEILPILEEAGLGVPTNASPLYGGRRGEHPPEFASLITDMQRVNRLDPGATW